MCLTSTHMLYIFTSPVSTHILCARRHIPRGCHVISAFRKSGLVSLVEGLMKQIDEQDTESAREDYADEDEQVLIDMPTETANSTQQVG